MKIFCKFPTVKILKLNFWFVICIANNFIWTTLRQFSQYLDVFAPSDSRFSNSCISAKYCPIITNHTSMERLYSAFRWCINLNFAKLTLMTGFVVQGHICSIFSFSLFSSNCPFQWIVSKLWFKNSFTSLFTSVSVLWIDSLIQSSVSKTHLHHCSLKSLCCKLIESKLWINYWIILSHHCSLKSLCSELIHIFKNVIQRLSHIIFHGSLCVVNWFIDSKCWFKDSFALLLNEVCFVNRFIDSKLWLKDAFAPLFSEVAVLSSD